MYEKVLLVLPKSTYNFIVLSSNEIILYKRINSIHGVNILNSYGTQCSEIVKNMYLKTYSLGGGMDY